MQVDDKVKIKGNSKVFIVEIVDSGYALIKKAVGNSFIMIDWYHQSELELV